jgi:hypothetical protein
VCLKVSHNYQVAELAAVIGYGKINKSLSLSVYSDEDVFVCKKPAYPIVNFRVTNGS